MNNWKQYAGSILLAGLLLQGCGTTEETPVETSPEKTSSLELYNASSSFFTGAIASGDADQTDIEVQLSMKVAALDANDEGVKEYIDKLITDNGFNTRKDAYTALAQTMTQSSDNTASGAPGRGPVLDSVKDGLVNLMDTSVGNAISGAAFDVVLNSEGVTIFMIDMARNSDTMSQIMIDAIGANWDLTKKMCPMLQTNKEFGEKFAALAYEKDGIDGRPDMGRFFFANVDANLYGCLTDAMLLSNDEDNIGSYEKPVIHSTTGYMGELMDRYAVDFFINPADGVATKYGNTNAFASLMLSTGENVDYNSTAKTFEHHGDGNELINEQLFYAMFKTPTSTESFVDAMDQLSVETRTMFMDNIFLGAKAEGEADTYQGYLNIISIGGAMYEGIFGSETSRAYGFGSYTTSLVGFAGLIPSDRYFTYAKAFVDAGFEYAAFYGINVWDSALEGARAYWDGATGTSTTSGTSQAPARSAGLGLIGSDWFDDILDLFIQGYSNFSISDIAAALMDSESSVFDELGVQADVAYHTVLDGRDSNGTLTYQTEITNPIGVDNDIVYGFHGLVELAIREDLVNVQSSEGNTSYTMTDAEEDFVLPQFADLTWNFVYTAATDGAVAYYNSFVNAGWLADLSDNELIRNYFYPSADNLYIPSWMLAIDWLTLPDNYNTTDYADYTINFDSGYMDIYMVSSNGDLLNDVEFNLALAPIKDNIEASQIEMSSDSIIAVDATGMTLEGLFVYKIRVVTPEDTAAVLAYLSTLGENALNAIGIDSTNAALTVAAE
ncbi:hypothetical protein [Sulfurimonas sp. HSL3-7]|uniref:hypothetical protein n=1 Tax=Sulfonitrofixus jiaomeiensis TaxID=3131938 RepID=UPI0031F91083